MSNYDFIEENPANGLIELRKLIERNSLYWKTIGKPFLINKDSTVELRVLRRDFSDAKKHTYLLSCETSEDFSRVNKIHPFTKEIGPYIWEYRIYTPGQSKQGRGVNVPFAFHHNRGCFSLQ